jgi:hydroxyethylthiazole kinase-like uncharacterized protein yjeF
MNPVKYYTAAQTREFDRLAIEQYHIPGFELMCRAGHATWEALQSRWPEVKVLLIFCGTGNNGGDGFVISSLAKRAGLEVTVILAGDPEKITGDALKAKQQALADRVPIIQASQFNRLEPEPGVTGSTVIVDALLGTGLAGSVRAPYKRLISLINANALPVVSVDIPSGLCSDTGVILGSAVKADLTVTFIARKIGMILAQGPQYCGDIIFDTLGIPDAIYQEL